jgi:mannosyltransferase
VIDRGARRLSVFDAFPRRSLEIRWWVVMLAITLFAAFLRLYHIGSAALWTDEAASVWIATKHSLWDIWHVVSDLDARPPLYYWLLHLWLVAGNDESALRLMSALFGTLTVPTIFCIGRIVGGRDLASTAAFILAVSPVNVHYSQEVRMYSLLAFGGAVSILGQAWLLRLEESASLSVTQGSRGGVPPSPKRDPARRVRAAAAWVAYVLGTAVALWVQYPAVFLPIAANVILLLRSRYLAFRVCFVRNWILAQLAIVALCAPLIPLYIHQSSGPNFPPIPNLRFGTILEAAMPDLLMLEVFGPLTTWVALLPALLPLAVAATAAGLAIWKWKREPHWSIFTLGLWLVPLAGGVIVSLVWRPVLVSRALIWTTIPMYLLIAGLIMQLRQRPLYRATMVSILVIVFACGLGLRYFWVPKRETWRPVAEYVARSIRPGDVLLFNDSYVQLPFDYYFSRYQIRVRERGVPHDFGANSTDEHLMTRADVPALQSLAKGEKRLWLIYSHNWYTDPLRLVPESLGQTGRLIERRDFASKEPIAVFLYQSRP